MTTFVFANNVNTTLAAAASNTATTLTLASSTGLPSLSAGEIMPLTLNDAATGLIYEIVYVTAISGVTLTVERAQEGTGAQSWSIGDYAFSTNTADTTAPVNGNPANAFETSTATAGDNSNLAASTAFVHATLPGTSQTMQNMTSSRAMSTVYTNNEPNPIVVGVYGTMNTSSTAMLAVLNGYTAVPLTGSQVQSLPGDSSLIFEVPAGWTYEVYPSSGSVTAFTWMERR